MKKILITTLVACALVTSALAQGTVTFNASAGKIKYSTDGTTIVSAPLGNPAQIPGYGNLNIALYGAAPGTTISLLPTGIPDLSAWKIGGPIISQIAPLAGGVPAKIVTMDAATGAAGNPIQLIVVAWAGSATSWADATTPGGPNFTPMLAWSGDSRSGGALGWNQVTGTSTSPAVMVSGANAFNGLVLAPIPEPSTFALAGLGAAALLIFRRRK